MKRLGNFCRNALIGIRNAIYPDSVMYTASIESETDVTGRRLKLEEAVLDSILEKFGVQSWFKYIHRSRETRWDIWQPCEWIRSNVPSDAFILETACGVGFNLIWLAENGFSNLCGFDIDDAAINAGLELSKSAAYPIEMWVDDAICPVSKVSMTFDVIVALNWTMLLDEFQLDSFLGIYSNRLRSDGLIILDVIDAEYGNVDGHEFHTSDGNLDEAKRRPSEYRRRFSHQEVEKSAKKCGLNMHHVFYEPQRVSKRVYILKAS